MNKKLKRILMLAGKVLVLTLLLLVLSGVGSTLLPANAVGGGAEGGAGQAVVPSMSLVLAIMFLQVVALAIPIVRSRWHGWGLAGAIFVVYFGTVTFMSQIESLVYLGGKMPGGLTSGLFAMGLFVAAVFSPVAVLTLGKWRRAPANGRGSGKGSVPRLDLGRWGWRIGAAGVLFLALYYLFGYYIAWQDPELRAYYGGTDPGSFVAQMESVVRATPWMLPLQFARGLLWVGLGLLLIRSMRGSWWHAGLAIALLFAAPSLYLLFPNPVMPDFPRMTHLIETLPYQFLFGWFLAWFFRDRKPVTVRSAASVAS